MDYFIIKYSKMRQQEIEQEFEAIHRIRMSRPEGLNRRRGAGFRNLKNVLLRGYLSHENQILSL